MTKKINDLNLKQWQQHDDILTDSLWLLGERDKSGAHNNAYHGNFIPQIPNQLMRRFTQKGDVVLDAFLGHGTTLIEAKRLGRHGIGIELLDEVACAAQQNIANEPAKHRVASEIIVANSASQKARNKVITALNKIGHDEIHLLILHPPYHDIIKFSDNKDSLCNAASVDAFTKQFGKVIANFSSMLARHRYVAIVIGDKYSNSEWVPLGFYLMQETQRRDPSLKLKSVVVKNMAGNRAKQKQQNLWRYRALAGGFYIFKHEYILLFQKH